MTTGLESMLCKRTAPMPWAYASWLVHLYGIPLKGVNLQTTVLAVVCSVTFIWGT